jgi:biotin carboxylase
LAVEVVKRGFKCVRIFSVWDSPLTSLVQQGVDVEFDATVQYNDTSTDTDASTNQTLESLRSLPFIIVAVIPGAETGVELADRLSNRLGLRSNGEELSLARRNKYLMGERVRQANVRAVKQQLCRSIEEVQVFIMSLYHPIHTTLKAVIKPVQSAGSDDVFLVTNMEDAIAAFKRIDNKRNGLGLINDGVLVQEFLEGREYVIDQVSKHGKHKLAAIWEYDKRKVNNVGSFPIFSIDRHLSLSFSSSRRHLFISG